MFISNNNFKLTDLPNFHPELEHYERLMFWKTEKRKCIEGFWSSGKWMPGPLYYYINFHKIQLENLKSGSQYIGLPFLRDIDWELFFLYEECRGFSGFSNDLINTCDRKYGPEKTEALLLKRITEKEISQRKYIDAREYLRSYHGKDLGKPLYNNSAKSFISIQSRGGGKTFASTAIATHNFLFDGAIDYDEYLKGKEEKNYLNSDTIVGAIDTKYSNPFMKKIMLAMEHLPGSYGSGDEYYPSPFSVSFSGSTTSNKDLTSFSGSVLRHRTFADNPLAANGPRPNLVTLDEIGFFYNIIETWAALDGSEMSKTKNNMVIWALGTGGLVSGKAALYAEKIFRNPQDFNCIEFDDVFENRGKIGYFVPYTKTLNEFKKGENLITDEDLANKYIQSRREKAKKSSDPRKYQGEIINGPILPSEAFLLVESSYFPTMLLKEQLSNVEGGPYKKYMDSSFRGHLIFDENGVLDFHTIQDLVPIREFPLGKNDDKKGCIEIFMKPQRNDAGVIPSRTYIAGMDVVDKAKSTTDSLPSIFVMNRYTRQIVAEYTGRTDDPNDFYEICRKLLLYYNATGMYEQNLPGLFTYFDTHKCTYLLADTPYQLRNADTYKEGTNTSKGINASGKVNSTARDFIKSWLNEQLSDRTEKRAYETIYTPALLKELIMWNPDANFDRVSSLGMLMWHDATMFKEVEKRQKEVKGFLDDPYWAKMGITSNNNSFGIPDVNYYS